jgi:hypothetical protein
MIRGGTLSVAPMLQLLPAALAMMAEAVSAAFMGWRWYTGPRAARGDGTALVVENFLPQGQQAPTLCVVVRICTFGVWVAYESSE